MNCSGERTAEDHGPQHPETAMWGGPVMRGWWNRARLRMIQAFEINKKEKLTCQYYQKNRPNETPSSSWQRISGGALVECAMWV